MTWIFGSFLVTPWALTSCHVVINKQGDDSASGQSDQTGVKPEGDHVITKRSDLDREQRIESRAGDRQPIRGVLDVSDDTAYKGVQALAPPGSRKKIWDKKKSPIWVYVSPSISQTNNKQWSPFENKMRDIFL